MFDAGVKVTRDGNAAVIVHDCAPDVAIRIELGVHAATLSDREVLERYHRKLHGLGAALIADPQLRWDEGLRRWQPSSNALRCVVEPSQDEPVIYIDDVELSFAELGSLMAGHGAGICLLFLDD